MTRSYDMTKRDQSAEETRRRVIDAAHELLGRRDGGNLTIQEIADAAGVSRATIYNRIGPRQDLLRAVFVDQGRIIEFDRVLAAMKLPAPEEAIVAMVRESCRAWGVIPVAIRRTFALAAIDPMVDELVARFEGYRRRELAALARRAHREGALAAGVSSAQAAATLTVTSSFAAYELVETERSAAAAAGCLVRMAATALGLERVERGPEGRSRS